MPFLPEAGLGAFPQSRHKFIILDRDGVINIDRDDYIKTVDEWVPIPGSLEAISRLTKAGYTVGVATNQSGLAKGYFTLETLNAMHNKLNALLQKIGGKIDAIAYCPHNDTDNCNCRKPRPGLILSLESQLAIPAKHAFLVGDKKSDLLASIAVGSQPILVRTGKGTATENALNRDPLFENIPVFENLAQFVDTLLRTTTRSIDSDKNL
ncbi:MAG: D-glycero-beta-D-manno-heptose 1,7-bisphosphate 7-phosphatase [Hahellaceae bacterium]|nr:D-glycero-beta-D-manno-heptose 1,7-bisphosphate 7-phosphatase [Hahellaceae bacterium]